MAILVGGTVGELDSEEDMTWVIPGRAPDFTDGDMATWAMTCLDWSTRFVGLELENRTVRCFQ